ncbi:MAG: YesL family protein [Smithella sp.]
MSSTAAEIKKGILGIDEISSIPRISPKWFSYLIRSHYLKLIGLNLLVIFFSIPIITIPSAMCGMTNIILKLIKDERVEFWEVFFGEFKNNFLQRFLAWLILILIPVSFYGYANILKPQNEHIIILIVLGCISYAIQCYLFPIFVTVNIPVSAALKNAFLLVGIEWKTTLKMLLTSGVLILLCFVFTLYAIPVVVVILFALCQLINCIYSLEPIEHRLINHNL